MANIIPTLPSFLLSKNGCRSVYLGVFKLSQVLQLIPKRAANLGFSPVVSVVPE